MKMIAADVAARLGMQTRKAATESHATTGEMASAKAAAHMSAAEPAAHMSAAEPAAHMSAAEPAAHMSAAEPAAHMTATAEPAAHMTATAEPATVSRKRVGGQSPGESGSRQQHDHGLT
jgi:hypothetical protein